MKSKRAEIKKRKREELINHVETRKRLKQNEKVAENVPGDAQAEDSLEKDLVHRKIIIDSEAELEDKVVPQDSELEVEELSELSDFDNIYDDKPVQIPEADLDMASNFLNSFGEELMEEDILQFL